MMSPSFSPSLVKASSVIAIWDLISWTTSLSGTSFSTSLNVMVLVMYAAFQSQFSPVIMAVARKKSSAVRPSTVDSLNSNPSTFTPRNRFFSSPTVVSPILTPGSDIGAMNVHSRPVPWPELDLTTSAVHLPLSSL